MRMIYQLGQFLTRVLFHKNAHEFPLARRELEAAYKSLLGMSPAFIRNFSDMQVVEMFGSDEETVAPKCYVLGSLLKEEAEMFQLEGNDAESPLLFTRSLSLLLTSFNTAKDEAEQGHSAKIDALLIQLQREKIPFPVMEKLFHYFEIRGAYDKAEDMLFELVESDRGWKTAGLAFYRCLLERPDSELETGGLSRAEALEGIEKLQRA
jgi:hypothetical protein